MPACRRTAPTPKKKSLCRSLASCFYIYRPNTVYLLHNANSFSSFINQTCKSQLKCKHTHGRPSTGRRGGGRSGRATARGPTPAPECPGRPAPPPPAHPPCCACSLHPDGHRGSHALQTTGVAWPTHVGSVPSLASKSLLQSQKQILLWIWACWKQVCVPGPPSHLWQNSALGSQTRDSVQSSWARPAGEDRGLSPCQPMKRSHLPSTF